MKHSRLICTACGKEYSQEYFRCTCGEPLEIVIENQKLIKLQFRRSEMLESFSHLLPELKDNNFLSMGEGLTPLTRLENTTLDGLELFVKNESINPTWSFKDRGSYLATLDAINQGYRQIGTVSTGNMGASVAAYGKRANLRTTILISDSIPEEKIAPIAIYGPRVLKVTGDYGDLYHKSLEIGAKAGIYMANSDVPMRVEGSKTIAFEIFLQLGEKVPDFIVVPTSSGGNLRGIEKGFRELKKFGFSNTLPRIVVAQAMGCCPIHLAFSQGAETVSRFIDPCTVAHAIENPFPPSGNAVLKILRETDGITVAVDEASILKAQRDLAEKGLFAQPASAVPFAALNKLQKEVNMKRAVVVAVLTGSGLKYPTILEKHPSKIEITDLISLGETLERNPNCIQ